MKTRFLAVSIAMAVISLTPACAQKTTIDPNTKKAPVKESDPVKLDPRLAKKITYFSTGKRLHTVLEEIAKQTGVTIACGKNTKDWQVRDIPVVVCANDLQLGMLLRSIADATHLALTPSVVKGERRYKIWRDHAREKQLTDFFTQRPIAALARSNWEWDALVKLADMPLPEKKRFEGEGSYISLYADPRAREEVMTYAKILATLPQGTKEKVFAGEKMSLKVKDLTPPLSNYVESLYRDKYDNYQRQIENCIAQDPNCHIEPIKDLTDEEMQNACLNIEFSGGNYPTVCTSLQSGGFSTSPASNPQDVLSDITDKLPPEPQCPQEPRTDYAPNLEQYGYVYSSDTPEQTFKIEKPKDKKEFTIADYIAEFAKASGYSVICEDFQSHKRYNNAPAVGKDVTFNNAVSDLRNRVQVELYKDKSAKLLVGSAYSWTTWHKNLAPESVINNLRDKLNGNGVELDDAVTIFGLTDEARNEWVSDSRDLVPINWYVGGREKSFWKLYNDLSPKDKALAKSEDGLSLSRLDIDYLVGIFQKAAKAEKANSGERENANVANSVPTDPSIIARLTLRIIKHETTARQTIRTVDLHGGESERIQLREDAPPEESYSMTIAGDGVHLSIQGPYLSFPIYSYERETEIWKKFDEKKTLNR